MKTMKTFKMLLIILAFVACDKNDDQEPVYVNNYFELTAATDWRLVNETGIDTYIGYYQKDDYKIEFDCGDLSFGDFNEIMNSPELPYYEELIINGINAKIVKEDRVDGIRLSAYIDKGDNEHKNRLYTFNNSDDQLFINIIKSHRFK